MTQNDIIKLMQQACDPDKKPAWHNEFWTITQQELERFADLVLRAERQACAELVQVHMTAAETYIPTMDDAVEAGDNVLMNEQAALLRECRAALDDLLKKKPLMAAMLCGSTTLGNLRASLYEYRPKGVL